MTRPLFTSFEDAWRWFADGGELESLASRRERFTQGRAQFLSFQAPIVDSDALALVADIVDTLRDIDGIEPMPVEHLHISIRGAGFQVLLARSDDELSREDVGRAGEFAARTLRSVGPSEVTLGPVNIFPDALLLEVHDGGALAAIRRALADVTRTDTLIDDGHYLPHVTIATFDEPAAASTLRDRLPTLRDLPAVQVTIRRIDFARWWFTGFDDRESTEVEVVRSYTLRS